MEQLSTDGDPLNKRSYRLRRMATIFTNTDRRDEIPRRKATGTADSEVTARIWKTKYRITANGKEILEGREGGPRVHEDLSNFGERRKVGTVAPEGLRDKSGARERHFWRLTHS